MDLIEKTHNYERHPWELSRSHSVLQFLQKNHNDTIYADVGSGDQFFASQLKSLTQKNIYAIDIAYDKEVGDHGGIISLNSLSKVPDNSIDYFTVMDVLEHVEDDDAFLNEINKKLKPGGQMIITVPAMQFVFSSHDVFLKHYRRYSRKRLINKVKPGFIVEKCFYFYNSLLFLRILLLILEAMAGKKAKNVGVGLWQYPLRSIITRFFFTLLNWDFWLGKTLAKIHIYLPGLSLLAIVRKK